MYTLKHETDNYYLPLCSWNRRNTKTSPPRFPATSKSGSINRSCPERIPNRSYTWCTSLICHSKSVDSRCCLRRRNLKSWNEKKKKKIIDTHCVARSRWWCEWWIYLPISSIDVFLDETLPFSVIRKIVLLHFSHPLPLQFHVVIFIAFRRQQFLSIRFCTWPWKIVQQEFPYFRSQTRSYTLFNNKNNSFQWRSYMLY